MFSHTIIPMLLKRKLKYHAAAGALALVCSAGSGFGQPPEIPAPSAPMPPVLQNYQPVTAERLKNPESGNWLMIRRTYDGWGYSPLDRSRRRMSKNFGLYGCSRPAKQRSTKRLR